MILRLHMANAAVRHRAVLAITTVAVDLAMSM